MTNKITLERQLNDYYEREDISPQNFSCRHQDCCKSYCEPGKFQPRKEGVAVSDLYQERTCLSQSIPRIVVVSLSAPISRSNGQRGNDCTPLNLHWRETLAMTRSLLDAFLKSKLPKPARYFEDESARQIEKLFVHLRTAKCSSQQDEEDPRMYEQCGPYLKEELRIPRAGCNRYARRQGSPPV